MKSKVFSWKYFLSFILSLLFLFLSYTNIPVVYAATSLQACAQSPACAAGLASELNVRTHTAAYAISPFVKTLSISRYAGTTVDVTAKTVSTVSTAGGGSGKVAAFLSGAGAALAAFLTSDTVEVIQAEAVNNFCSTYSSSPPCGGVIRLDYLNPYGTPTTLYVTWYNLPQPNVLEFTTASGYSGQAWGVTSDTNIIPGTLTATPEPPKDWSDPVWDTYKIGNDSARNIAVETLSDSYIVQQLETSPLVSQSEVSSLSEDDYITIDVDGHVVQDIGEEPQFLPTPITITPEPPTTTETVTQTSTDADGNTTTTTTVTTTQKDGNTITIYEQVYDGDGSLIKEDLITTEIEETQDKPDDEESPGDVPIAMPSATGDSGFECVDCAEQIFSQVNFVDHAITVFANKFPFDVVGTMPPPGTVNSCPYVEAFDEQMEVCFVRDSIAFFKYPVWISFLIRVVLHV